LNRIHFIKTSLFGTFGLSILPNLFIVEFDKDLSYNKRIGKGNPALFR